MNYLMRIYLNKLYLYKEPLFISLIERHKNIKNIIHFNIIQGKQKEIIEYISYIH